MNLNDQTVNNTNQVNITDSLNSAVMELKIKRTATTEEQNSDDLFVYVDKNSMDNPSESRKQYLFELIKPLDYLDGISDEFIMQLEVKNNKLSMNTFVKRLIGETEDGEKSILLEPLYEELDYSQIILFSGINYIYSNYTNADITLVYPKDNILNKLYLNSAIYVNDNEDREECTLADIYYSNCFTKTEGRIDLEVNHITADCISSNNNKFSLDEEGNLIVKTITVADPISSTDLAAIYPIGSIYMNVNDINPADLFGGIWEQIKDCFLLACGDTYANGTTGGEANHKLTVNEMPSHTHVQNAHKHAWKGRKAEWGNTSGGNAKTLIDFTATSSYLACAAVDDNGVGSTTATNKNTGGSGTHNNMPPYLAVNVWKRVG